MQKNWILIRGLVRGVGHWGDLPETLKTAFPGDNFEFIEIPGNGTLNNEKSPIDMDSMVEAMRRQSRFIQQGQKVHIFAISLGAMIATAWANKYPTEVQQLVLINSSSAKHSKFYERLRPENYLKILGLAVGFKTRHTVRDREREILNMTVNSSERRAYALPVWTKESEDHPVHPANFVKQLIAAGNYRFPSEPPVPTVLLASENDHFVNVSCSKNLAKSWGCTIYFHPWAGHDLPLDDPEWVVQKLQVI
jgi:pimeloyl-ACP methyl ester carboxylesterase